MGKKKKKHTQKADISPTWQFGTSVKIIKMFWKLTDHLWRSGKTMSRAG